MQLTSYIFEAYSKSSSSQIQYELQFITVDNNGYSASDKSKIVPKPRSERQISRKHASDAKSKSAQRMKQKSACISKNIAKENTKKKASSASCKNTAHTMTSPHGKKPASPHDCIKRFRRKIQLGPVHICVICNRCLYRRSVKVFQDHKNSHVDNLNTNVVSSDGKKYICFTCSSKVSKNKIPCQAVFNKLAVIDIPIEISRLNRLETALISRRLLFKKVVIMSKGLNAKGQFAIFPFQ